MTWLIHNDIIDYETDYYPTHIMGKDFTLVTIYIGKAKVLKDEENADKAIGIYVSDNDYEKIDHTKIYILFHNPDMIEINDDLKTILSGLITDVEDSKLMDREHLHLWLCNGKDIKNEE